AVLDGYGPIPASMARRLVADGAHSFYRVLVDPRDGAPLEIGRTRYRLPETIKRWIRMRDATCTFPGCSNHTPDNDTDHLTAWHHRGTTNVSNLAQLCPKHHRLKHHSRWTPTSATKNQPPGWTSPTGRHYTPEQPDADPPQWPPRLLPAGRLADNRSPQLTEVVPVSAAAPPEDRAWQQLLAVMPPWPDPPPEEPPGDHLVDPDQLCPTDPSWDSLYMLPCVLPPDPQPDWELLLPST
ncbi:MAG: HNH endonuclease signature motif containing protein, partial [Actinomycetes bacterium]